MSMNNMGKPIPTDRKEAAMEQLREMGLTNKDDQMACISCMVEQLERDKPFEAQQMGMKYIDLTGTYRIFAVLLTGWGEAS